MRTWISTCGCAAEGHPEMSHCPLCKEPTLWMEQVEEERIEVSPVELFTLSVTECRAILTKIEAHLTAAAAIPPLSMTWGGVADADRVLYYLRHAAFAAGIGEEPGA